MYNKNGIVLRVETVINRPGEFRLFRIGRGRKPGYYAPIRKGVTNMQHYASIGLRANSSYLDALAQVDDPTVVYRELRRIAEPVIRKGLRTRALNPLRATDRTMFEAVMRGEFHLHGFKASDVGKQIGIRYSDNPVERKRQCARVNRKIRLLREHGLVARYGRSIRYRVTDMGARYMNAAIDLFHNTLPEMLDKAA